jgi:IPT/TIG domain-containing protein
MKRFAFLALPLSCSLSSSGPTACTTAADCAEGESCFQGVCTAPEELPALRLDTVDPIRAPARGGDTVTLRGAGFTPDMTVKFGEVVADTFTVDANGNQADVTVPVLSDQPGRTQVSASRPDGQEGTFEPFWAYLATLDFESVLELGALGGWAQPWDYDQDGDDDVLAIHFDTTSGTIVRLFKNVGGTFDPPVELACPPSGCPGTISARYDLDGDGAPDLLNSKDLHTVQIVVWDGAALRDHPNNIETVWERYAVVALDANADGRGDIAILTAFAAFVDPRWALELWLQTAGGQYERAGDPMTIAYSCDTPGIPCTLSIERNLDGDRALVLGIDEQDPGNQDDDEVVVTRFGVSAGLLGVVDELRYERKPYMDAGLEPRWFVPAHLLDDADTAFVVATDMDYFAFPKGYEGADVGGPLALGGPPSLFDWNLDGIDDVAAPAQGAGPLPGIGANQNFARDDEVL